MDCSLPGSSLHGISQARILEWVAISSSRGSPWHRDRTHVSCISRQILCCRATWEAFIILYTHLIIILSLLFLLLLQLLVTPLVTWHRMFLPEHFYYCSRPSWKEGSWGSAKWNACCGSQDWNTADLGFLPLQPGALSHASRDPAPLSDSGVISPSSGLVCALYSLFWAEG